MKPRLEVSMTRKLPLFAALVAATLFLTLAAERVALARIVGGTTTTTVTQPDIWCQGGSNQGTSNTATEVCLDWNGNITPTTTNAQTSGTSSLQWKSVETKGINLVGTGAVSFGGPAGLLVQTTSQLILTASAPAHIGDTVVVKYLTAAGGVNGYGICTSTSITVQSGTIAGGDSDWIWMSTGSVTTSLPVGSACR